MVLLDSQSPHALAQLPGYARFYRRFRKATGLFPSLARFGVMRLVYSWAARGLPPEARAKERAFWSTASHNRSLRDEVVALPAALSQAGRSVRWMCRMPPPLSHPRGGEAYRRGGQPEPVRTRPSHESEASFPRQPEIATLV